MKKGIITLFALFLSTLSFTQTVTSLNLPTPCTYSINNKIEICSGDSVFVENAWQTNTGVYYDTIVSSQGYDKIIITNLKVLPTYIEVQSVFSCQGDSVLLAGVYRFETGSYTDSLTSINGCDSLLITNLTVFPSYNDVQSTSLCQGDSVLLAGVYRFETGSYIDSLTSINGCDSLLITNLTVFPNYFNVLSTSICEGDSIFLEGEYRFEVGSYIDSLTSINGCDSILITNLTVFPNYFNVLATSICEGDSIFLEGEYQTETGSYTDNLLSFNGCDSLIITNLTVNTIPSIDLGIDTLICDNESIILSTNDFFQTYEWSNGTTNQILEVDINTFNYGENIIYLTVTDTNNCYASDTISVTIEICTFISSSEEMLSFEVFPNPASNNVTLLLKSETEKIQTVEIIKMDGDIINKISFEKQNMLKYNFNVNSLASGIYFIKVSTENNVYLKKLVIQ